LASAYWRHGLDRAFALRTDQVEDGLPDAILRPWIEVNQRLGRGSRPFQSVYDLFLNNFRLRSGRTGSRNYRLEDVHIENLDVLAPSFGNEPERIFYMSFVEIHAIAAPIVAAICTIERALVEDSPESDGRIVEGLGRIERSLRRCTATVAKIRPSPGETTYCDPVLWAKTVAIFAVPPSTYVQGGTSGTSTPFLFMMDALLSRDQYGTYYGKYVRDEASRLLPRIHQDFTRHVRELPLKSHILSKKSGSCRPRGVLVVYSQVWAGDSWVVPLASPPARRPPWTFRSPI
jgi:sulfite reductase (NADPH) flavoprotein alpha-component